MSSLHQQRGTWYARVKDVTGAWRAHATKATTKTEAKRHAQVMERQAEHQRCGLEPLACLNRSALLLALALVLPHVAGCNSPSAPSKVTVEERAFSFQVPGDWFPARFDQDAKAFVPEKGHQVGALKPEGSLLYASPRGDYLHFEFDPPGHGLEFDLEWTVETKGDRFVLLSEGPFCKRLPEDLMETCRTGDGSLLIQIRPWNLELRGHQYFIKFGNVKREQGVDHQAFRDILASFRAR